MVFEIESGDRLQPSALLEHSADRKRDQGRQARHGERSADYRLRTRSSV